jgi:hypothetical protein
LKESIFERFLIDGRFAHCAKSFINFTEEFNQMPSHLVKVSWTIRDPKTGSIVSSSNGPLYTQSRSESAVIAEIVKRNPGYRNHTVIIDSIEWK